MLGSTGRVVTVVADAGDGTRSTGRSPAHELAHDGLDLVVVAAGGGRPGRVAGVGRRHHPGARRDLGVPWQVLRSTIGAFRETARHAGVARFVVVGSAAGIAPVPGFAAYSAAKAALRSLALSVEHDEAAAGIRATVIEPGYVATPLTQPIPVPAEEMLAPDDVANAVRFLLRLSPQASVTELVMGRVGAGAERAVNALVDVVTSDARRPAYVARERGMAPRCPGRVAAHAARPPETRAVVDEHGAALTYASCGTGRRGSPGFSRTRGSAPATSCRCSCRTGSRPRWWRSACSPPAR